MDYLQRQKLPYRKNQKWSYRGKVEAGQIFAPDHVTAFIMPDKKLEKDGGKKLLKDHTLQLILEQQRAVCGFV